MLVNLLKDEEKNRGNKNVVLEMDVENITERVWKTRKHLKKNGNKNR